MVYACNVSQGENNVSGVCARTALAGHANEFAAPSTCNELDGNGE